MASNDDRIIEYFKDKKEGASSTKKENADQFQFKVFSDYIDANQLSEQLQIKLWDKLSQFNWMPFEEARELVRKLQLKKQEEYWKYFRAGKLPSRLPSSPSNTYKNDGWISYPDFLGYESLFRELLPFEEAREYARSLGLKSSIEWLAFVKTNGIPSNIPKRPSSAYKNIGWVSFGDWLGSRHRKGEYRSFEDSKKFAVSLKLKTAIEWKTNYEKGLCPEDIPKFPDQKYINQGWISWGDFLGTNTIASNLKKYWEFEEARAFVQTLGLKNSIQWKKFCSSDKFPNDLPRKPDQTYKNKGWKGMYDWLGRKEIARFNIDKVLLTYEEAKKIIHTFYIKNWKEWREFTKLENFPLNIPKNPSSYYKLIGWIDWGDWLGNGRISNSKVSFLSFEESKTEVKKIGLKSITEWRELCRSKLKPNNIPSNPHKVYENEWKGWGDWLGTGRVSNHSKKFISFIEAKKFTQSLGLKNEKEWRNWKKEGKLPSNIPAKPEVVYKDKGWIGYVDFLRND